MADSVVDVLKVHLFQGFLASIASNSAVTRVSSESEKHVNERDNKSINKKTRCHCLSNVDAGSEKPKSDSQLQPGYISSGKNKINIQQATNKQCPVNSGNFHSSITVNPHSLQKC